MREVIAAVANRIGYWKRQSVRSSLKIASYILSLTVFVPFLLIYMKQPLKLDYVWAALCIFGAVYFIFRS